MLANLVLEHLDLDLEIGEFLLQALGLDAKFFTLLLTHSDLLLEHNTSFDGYIILGFKILQRRGSIARLALKIVIGDLGVAELELQGSVGVSKGGDFLLKRVLRRARFGFGFSVFPLAR